MQTTQKRPLKIGSAERNAAMQMALERAQFVQRLREARKAAGLTQEQAAYKVGVTIKTWNRWEALSDNATPRARNLEAVIKLLGVDREYLMGALPAPSVRDKQLEEIAAKIDENNIMLKAVLAHLGISAESLVDAPRSLLDALEDKPAARKRRRRT